MNNTEGISGGQFKHRKGIHQGGGEFTGGDFSGVIYQGAFDRGNSNGGFSRHPKNKWIYRINYDYILD